MKLDTAFDPGFRVSKLDAGFLLLVLGVSLVLARFLEDLAIAAVFAALHFFLFCNVLRARRSLELLWAAAFVGLWSASYLLGVPSWPQTYSVALAITAIVTVVQLLLPSYHGALWTVFNPQLPQWWEEKNGRKG